MNLPAIRPLLPARVPRLPAKPAWARGLIPAVRGSVIVVATGLAVEYVLRALANRALAALTAAARPSVQLTDAAGRMSRTVVTEIIVQERFRRPR